MAAAGGALGEAAPAAADLQYPLAVAEPVEDAVVLARLTALEVGVAFAEERRGIGEARVEPLAVELVADVVVGADVAARPGRRVAPDDPVDGAEGEAVPAAREGIVASSALRSASPSVTSGSIAGVSQRPAT